MNIFERSCALGLATVTLAGCAAAPHTRAAGAVLSMSVRPVAWNPSQVPTGRVRAVAEAGNLVAVFGDAGATVFASGAVVATDSRVTDWIGAGTLRGADGTPDWIVGVDGSGHLRYLRAASAFEDVTARYGLGGRRVLAATMFDRARVGFLLEDEVVVADGAHAERFAYGAGAPWASLTGGGGFGAALSPGFVTLFQAANPVPRSFALPGVARVALGPDGRLYAATRRAVYAAGPSGDLSLVYDAEADTIHGLVASGDRVWFADGSELGAVAGDRVSETNGARIAVDAALAASPGGDVWVIGGAIGAGERDGSGLRRLTRASDEPTAASTWSSAIAPLFARDCASCHLPDGVAGTDLSSSSAWQRERAAIRDRVVVERSMPPEGHALPEADRDAIRAWTERPAP